MREEIFSFLLVLCMRKLEGYVICPLTQSRNGGAGIDDCSFEGIREDWGI
jgi:hypothetical protein